jgi:hypothetical protein
MAAERFQFASVRVGRLHWFSLSRGAAAYRRPLEGFSLARNRDRSASEPLGSRRFATNLAREALVKSNHQPR